MLIELQNCSPAFVRERFSDQSGNVIVDNSVDSRGQKQARIFFIANKKILLHRANLDCGRIELSSPLRSFKFAEEEKEIEIREKKVWRANGTLMSHCWTNKFDLLHGEMRLWHENGMLYSIDFWINGEQHGRSLMWWSNGKRREISFWNMGKQVDFVNTRVWHEDGEIFFNGKKWGSWPP